MNRREALRRAFAGMFSLTAAIGFRFSRKFGYVDVDTSHKNGWVPCVVLLNSVNVADDCVACDDVRGFVDVYVCDNHKAIRLNAARDGVLKERLYGHVQFFPKGQSA